MAPTTLIGQRSSTTPGGRDPQTTGYPIRMCELLDQLDAPAFLGRTSVASPLLIRHTKRLVKKVFQYQMDGMGFCMLEVLSPCPTYWRMKPTDAHRFIEETVVKTFPLGIVRDVGAAGS